MIATTQTNGLQFTTAKPSIHARIYAQFTNAYGVQFIFFVIVSAVEESPNLSF